MNLKHITIEHILYIAILVLAIGIRVFNVDDVPLSDFEANHAIQALHLSRGDSPDISPGPAYPMLTGLTFFLFSDTNAYARIWPTIAGICLVLFPYFIRAAIGRKAALIMALGLALSPTLVAFSRLAGSDIMAAAFAMMAIGMAVNRKPILSGIFVGLALMSGPSSFEGLLGIGLTFLFGNLLTRLKLLDPLSDNLLPEYGSREIFSGVIATLTVLIAVGTLFLLFPTGLSSITSILPAYLSGWVTFSQLRISDMLVNLLVYNPVVLVFGILGIISAWRFRNVLNQWLSLWVGISLLLAIFYPGRDVFSWLWLLIPLWMLAAMEIAKYFRLEGSGLLPALGQALLIFILMALGWLNLAGLSLSGGGQETIQLRWAIIAGTIFLGGITTMLIGLGWSVSTAKQGLAWGVLLGFGFYGFSLMWGLSQLRANGELELISIPPVTRNAEDLQETLGDLSEWRTGMRDTLDVVLTTSSPSIVWEMRNWKNAKFFPSIPIGELPSVIISSEEQPEPDLPIGYRGQDFTWWVTPGWEGVLPGNWPIWLVSRNAPLETRNIILWARLDLFPGGMFNQVDQTSSDIQEELPFNSLPVE